MQLKISYFCPFFIDIEVSLKKIPFSEQNFVIHP